VEPYLYLPCVPSYCVVTTFPSPLTEFQSIFHLEVSVPQLRSLVMSLPPEGLGFNPRQSVQFVIDQVALGQGFLQEHQLCPVIITPVLHAYPFIYNQTYIILAFNVHGSVHRNNILIYIQQDATLHSFQIK